MNILITGATGFIGRFLVLRLLRDGHHLTALTRSKQRAQSLLGSQVDLALYQDSKEKLTDLLSSQETVINLAGESIFEKRWSDKRKNELYQSRIGSTDALIDLMQSASPRPKTLISASAVGYYGDQDDQELTEDHPSGTDFLAQLASDWETSALETQKLGVRVVILRIGLVLGLGGGLIDTLLPIFRKGLGGPIGTGRQMMPWIHIGDLVEIMTLAAKNETLHGAYNAVSPQPVSNQAFTQVLAQTLGRPAKLRVPASMMKLKFGEASSALLGGQRALPDRLSKSTFDFRFETLEQALSDLLSIDGIHFGQARDVPDTPYLATRKPRYQIDQHNKFNAPIDEVFDFFSSPQNLGIITPASMSFEIVSPVPDRLEPGTQIEYRIGLNGVPMRWITLIESFVPQKSFTDCQLKGPYRCWCHEHRFEADGRDTCMHDRVLYTPPFGPVGSLGNQLFIRQKLEDIFSYRSQAMGLRFGKMER